MKYGYLKGHKVAECQNSQTQLMARFLKEGVVDEWRDAEVKTAPAKEVSKAVNDTAPITETRETAAPQQEEAAKSEEKPAENISDFPFSVGYEQPAVEQSYAENGQKNGVKSDGVKRGKNKA